MTLANLAGNKAPGGERVSTTQFLQGALFYLRTKHPVTAAGRINIRQTVISPQKTDTTTPQSENLGAVGLTTDVPALNMCASRSRCGVLAILSVT